VVVALVLVTVVVVVLVHVPHRSGQLSWMGLTTLANMAGGTEAAPTLQYTLLTSVHIAGSVMPWQCSLVVVVVAVAVVVVAVVVVVVVVVAVVVVAVVVDVHVPHNMGHAAGAYAFRVSEKQSALAVTTKNLQPGSSVQCGAVVDVDVLVLVNVVVETVVALDVLELVLVVVVVEDDVLDVL
jgi:hypothetical protein